MTSPYLQPYWNPFSPEENPDIIQARILYAFQTDAILNSLITELAHYNSLIIPQIVCRYDEVEHKHFADITYDFRPYKDRMDDIVKQIEERKNAIRKAYE